jgi:hypothetical protein
MSSVCLICAFVGDSGWSWQYFTRTCVVPAGTSKGTST